MTRRMLLLAAVTLGVACSSGQVTTMPPPAPQLDPVGVYDFSMDFDGMGISGTFTIEGEAGAYSGEATADVGNARLAEIAADGMVLTFIGDTPDGAISFRLVFVGSEFTGEWEGMDSGGMISGSKRAS